MTTIPRLLSVTALLGASLLGACSSSDSTTIGDEAASSGGAVELSLASVPANVACLRLTVEGTRKSTQLVSVSPGGRTTFLLRRLPIGRATVDGEAFPVPCNEVGSYRGEPSFVADEKVIVRIDPFDVARVALRLIRNARIAVGIEFEEEATPYLVPVAPGVVVKELITTGQSVGAYRMAGLPDGLGAYDNGDGTFTVLMNHELPEGAGIARAHGSKGAFVSKWTVRKADLAVLGGADLIERVALWDKDAGAYAEASPGASFRRFCSADLAPVTAFYDAAKGIGFDGRLLLSGEEVGATGRAFAHGMDGVSYELPRLGKLSFENVVANPAPSPRTIVVGLDDGTPGQVYVYVGTKTNAGSPVARAGLTNGTLYGVRVAGAPSEDVATGIPAGSAFTLAELGNVENGTGEELETASNEAAVTRFNRPEDGAWDPTHPEDFYFVTTGSFTTASRLFRLRFSDLSNNPAAGGVLEMLLDGSEGQKMLDNVTIDRSGHVYLQEDVGNNAHIGRVFRYDVTNDTLTEVVRHDPLRFAPGAPQFLTQDEESSGIVDATAILGPGWYLLDVQAHYATDEETVEGGQLLAIFDPFWLDTSSTKVDLAVLGDAPYGTVQIEDFPNLVRDINASASLAGVVHVGDIKNGSSRCDDSYFARIAGDFAMFSAPFVYTPGDNEWTDCHRANNGAYDPIERLAAVRRTFFPTPGRTLGAVKKDVLAQSALPGFETFVENTLWTEAQVTFSTVHVVGSNNSLAPWYGDDTTGTKVDDPVRRVAEERAREAAGLEWLERTFALASRSSSKGVVLFMQADTWDAGIFAANQFDGFTATVRRLADLTRAYGKPVLLVQGDSHGFLSDNPLASGDPRYGVDAPVPNLTRIVVQGSTTAPLTEWLRLRIDPSTPGIFSWARNPR